MDLKVQVLDFGPFVDSGEITLSPGLNTIVGLNNAGKTAFLNALFSVRGFPIGPASGGGRWRNLQNVPERMRGYTEGKHPRIRCRYQLDQHASNQLNRRLHGEGFVPRQPGFNEITLDLSPEENGPWIRSVALHGDGTLGTKYLVTAEADFRPNDMLAGAARPPQLIKILKLNHSGGFGFRCDDNTAGELLGWPNAIFQPIFSSAQRNAPLQTQARSEDGDGVLEDASRVPNVLYRLRNSKHRSVFDKIESELIDFFPEISGIGTNVDSTTQAQPEQMALVATIDGNDVPVAICGSGVWQTLVLLTAAYETDEPRLFLLDEPTAFLHPAAERHLAAFFARMGKERGHIFCVATHSHVMANHSERRLWCARNGPNGSRLSCISGYRDALQELGAQNSDILPTDAVVFVEGESDKAVFDDLNARVGARISVIPLGGDGPFTKKDGGRHILKLTSSIISSISPLGPIPSATILDRDGWSESEIAELSRRDIHFLDLPEIENYFICPDAIAEAFGCRPEDVKQIAGGKPATEKGSKIIEDILQRLCRIEYRKKQHLYRIASAAIRANWQPVQGLKALLDQVFKGFGPAEDQPRGGTASSAG